MSINTKIGIDSSVALQVKSLALRRAEALKEEPAVKEYLLCLGVVEEIDAQLGLSAAEIKTPTSKKLVENQSKNVVPDSDESQTERKTYDSSWSMSNKAEYIIKQKGKPLTTRDIISAIEENEPNLLKQNDFDRVQKNLASTLKQKIDKNKTFFRFRVGDGQEYYYGLIAEKDKYNGMIPQTLDLSFN